MLKMVEMSKLLLLLEIMVMMDIKLGKAMKVLMKLSMLVQVLETVEDGKL